MNAGVYEHNGNPYLLIGLARSHATGEEIIVYVPLLTKPEWSGTARLAFRTVEDFNKNFTWVGERLP
jgi:hypothetical protein